MRGHLQLQVLRVYAPEGPEGRAGRRASPLTGVTVAVAWALTGSIAPPFASAMADGGPGWMPAPVALPCLGGQPRAVSWAGVLDEATARPSGRALAPPPARLARGARPEAGGPSVGIGAVALALRGPATWRVPGGTGGRAVVPRRSGPVRRPHTPCRSSSRLARRGSGPSAGAGAPCAVACGTSPTHGRSAPGGRLGRCRAARGPAGRGGGGAWQRRGGAGA